MSCRHLVVRFMFPYSVPPPPPPPMAPPTQWVPPPPPMESHDPLDTPHDWYIDLLSRSVTTVIAKIPELDRRFGTRTTLVQGGDVHHHWARFLVHGKPVGIHHMISELFKIAPGVEVGYIPDAPFHNEPTAPIAPTSNIMPVYHAAWVNFTKSKPSRV